ncbi:hypothetical protein [Kibdelosporangium persicum]|nr:hypothetical protein [Kibdelosporangium persicum]
MSECNERRKVDAAITEVTKEHPVLRLDGESNLYGQVNSEILKFDEWVNTTRRGLLAFAIRDQPPNFDGLSAFDAQAHGRVSTRSTFDALAAVWRPSGCDTDEYLSHVVNHERPGDVSGQDHEARGFAALRFRGYSLPASPIDVQVSRAGVRGQFHAFASAIGTQNDDHTSLLAPVGIESSWCTMADAQAGCVCLVDDLTATTLAQWLSRDGGDGPRAVYVPLVNSLTGQVLTRRRAYGLARVVLRHNHKYPHQPVFVFADDSAIDTCHSEVVESDIQPIGAVTGADIGEPTWGRMSDWTLSVISPHLALPTSPIAFAITHNKWLRQSMECWNNSLGYASTCALDELIAAAAFCLVPKHWFDEINDHTADNLHKLRAAVLDFNTAEFGFDGLAVSDQAAGGWHTALYFSPRLFPHPVEQSFDAFRTLLNYHCPVSGSKRVALLPGEVLSWSHDPQAIEPWLTIRVNLSAPTEDFEDFVWQLGVATASLWRKSWTAAQSLKGSGQDRDATSCHTPG